MEFSSQLFIAILAPIPTFVNWFVGLTGGIRTPDQRIRNPLLYPAELRSELVGPP